MVPSLEKLESRTSGVRMGLSVSTPKSDQVPLEQKAKLPLPGMAATAEAVSWVPTAAKLAALMPSSSHSSGRSLPRSCPARSISVKIFSGRPSSRMVCQSQSRVVGL